MITYTGQSPADIRTGDRVVDADGREFTAESDAVPEMGDYVVNAWWKGDIKSLILDKNSLVTISYDESVWKEDEF